VRESCLEISQKFTPPKYAFRKDFKTIFLRYLGELSSDWAETYETVENYESNEEKSFLVRSGSYFVSYGLRNTNCYAFPPLAREGERNFNQSVNF
jgi:hypothetical protein